MRRRASLWFVLILIRTHLQVATLRKKHAAGKPRSLAGKDACPRGGTLPGVPVMAASCRLKPELQTLARNRRCANLLSC